MWAQVSFVLSQCIHLTDGQKGLCNPCVALDEVARSQWCSCFGTPCRQWENKGASVTVYLPPFSCMCTSDLNDCCARASVYCVYTDNSTSDKLQRKRTYPSIVISKSGFLRPLFTFDYCTVVAVSASSDTAKLSRYQYLPTPARSVNPGHGPRPSRSIEGRAWIRCEARPCAMERDTSVA